MFLFSYLIYYSAFLPLPVNFYFFVFYLFYLFIFRERGMEGEREGEKHQCVVASHMPPPGTWPTTQAGMCPDWEWNQ